MALSKSGEWVARQYCSEYLGLDPNMSELSGIRPFVRGGAYIHRYVVWAYLCRQERSIGSEYWRVKGNLLSPAQVVDTDGMVCPATYKKMLMPFVSYLRKNKMPAFNYLVRDCRVVTREEVRRYEAERQKAWIQERLI